MLLLPIFFRRRLPQLHLDGTPLATLSFSGPPSETANGECTCSPRGLPRCRPFFKHSASTRTLMGLSPSSAPALDGARSFAHAELSRPRFNPTPCPRPTSTSGTPSAVSSGRLSPRMTGASPALVSPLMASALARRKSTNRRLTSMACPPRPSCPLVSGPLSMSTPL